MNLYISVHDFMREPSGLEIASLLGNVSRLSGAHIVGTTTLNLTSNTTVALSKYDRITIFDGASSELVVVASSASVGASSITILSPGLVYAHADGVSWCSDGTSGSLADQIGDASTWLENICQQSLFQQTYTNETLRMPTLRASIDNQGMLAFRPRHFPVIAESGIAIESSASVSVTYDATQIILDGGSQVVYVPWLIAGGSGGSSTYSILSPVSRTTQLWLKITYTAGYASIPGDAKEACTLLLSDILSKRQDPTGADHVTLGKKQLRFAPSGDISGKSRLVKRAEQLLQAYNAEAY